MPRWCFGGKGNEEQHADTYATGHKQQSPLIQESDVSVTIYETVAGELVRLQIEKNSDPLLFWTHVKDFESGM